MFLKPVECDEYIFYGLYANVGEVTRVLGRAQMEFEDLQKALIERDLTLLKIGDNARARECIIGKQIDVYQNFIATEIMFDKNDNIQCLRHLNGKIPNIKLSKEEETQINRYLLQLGFFANARYYLVHSYSTHLIKD